MNHGFDVVEHKIAEAEFFLSSMASAGSDMFAFQCNLSAFLAASRTSTLALQQFKSLPGFANWYTPHQQALKTNPLAKFFLDLRNSHLHGGPYPIRGAVFSKGKAEYWFSSGFREDVVPTFDVLSACRFYFILLLAVFYDAYECLGVSIDFQQYYTKEHFSSLGLDIDDAEVDVCGWVCSSLIEEGYDVDARWSELRSRVQSCTINNLFYSYLGKVTRQPLEPEHYADFAYTPEEKGWVHVPAGYSSLDEYIQDRLSQIISTLPVE